MLRFALPSLLSTPPGADEPDAVEAFRVARNQVTASMAVPATTLLILCTLLWWPLDAVVLPADADVEAFRAFRLRGLVVAVAALCAFLFSARARAHALVLGSLAYALWLFGVAHALGSIPGDDVTPLANAWLGIVPLILGPETLLRRAGWASLAGAGMAFGYFGLHPDKLAAAGAAMQLSFGVFAVVLTVGLGEVTYRLLRDSFFQRRETERANAALEALTASLASQVDVRTAELRELAAHLTEVQEAERRRVARELHDDLGQNLTALRYTLARLERHVEGDAGTDLVDDISALLDGTFTTVRGVLGDLRPRILDDLGLVAALEWSTEKLATASEVTVRLHVDEAARTAAAALPRDVALALFRVAQEAGTNAVRHGRAAQVDVRVEARPDGIVLAVRDDGVGFDPSVAHTGFGLLGLRERMIALGGVLEVTAAPGRGVEVLARVPREALEAGAPAQAPDASEPPVTTP